MNLSLCAYKEKKVLLAGYIFLNEKIIRLRTTLYSCYVVFMINR